jgi:type I restriction enzyme S subunit
MSSPLRRLAPPEDWQLRRLDELLVPRREPVAPVAGHAYREIGIRSHGKGIFHKDATSAEVLGDKRVFQVVPHCLVLNIVFAWEGAVALTTADEEGMIASHRFPMFEPRTPAQVDVDYLRRYFSTPYGLRQLADASPGGAGRNRTLNQRDFGAIRVPLPPLPEQRKIAAIVSSVDETIEKTEAVIGQLQVVKKAMMQELLTRGMPGRHTRFKQTEIGEIPESWEVTELGSLIAEGPDNGIYRHASDYGSGTPIVRIDAYDAGDELRVAGLRRVRLAAEHIKQYRLSVGDILINRVNSMSHIGKAAVVRELHEDTVFESNIMRLSVAANRVNPAFAHMWISGRFAREHFRTRAKQAVAQASVNQGDVRALCCPVPTLREQQEAVSVVARLSERLSAEQEVLDRLRSGKAALAAALLSGDVRVEAGGPH